MKVLIVSQSDGLSGGYAAAIRLHNGLLKKEVNSKVLVQTKTTDNPGIIGPKTKFRKYCWSYWVCAEW